MQVDIFKPKAPPLFGLDISSSSVKMLEIVDAGKGAYRVERYTIESLPRDAVADGNINNLEAVSEAVKRGWKRLATNSAKLVNILGGYGYVPMLATMEQCVEAAETGRLA